MKLLSLLIPIALAAGPAVAESQPAAVIEQGIVEVVVTAQRPDARIPWRRERPGMRIAYGVVVAPGRVLTTEDTVRNATLVEIRRPGQPAKYTAGIVKADPRLNTALLSIRAEAAARFTPLAWNGILSRGAKVVLAQFDDAGQLQTGDGRVTKTAVTTLPSAPHAVLTLSVLSDLKLDRIGAPVLAGERLAGIAIRYDSASQITQVLPATLLKRFCEDAVSPQYRGFASAGLLWSPLVDPVKRGYYGLQDGTRGVLILRTIPESGSSQALRAGDVILRWDGCDIDSQGYYVDPDYGRLAFPHLIARRYPGDTVNVTILRDRREISVSVSLDAFDDARALVPMNTEGVPAEYLVEGGMVLRELSGDYLTSVGGRWMAVNNPQLVNLYLTRSQFPETPGDRVVLLVGILPDEVNKGYETIRDQIVTGVNGKPVASMKDVFAIRRADGGISRVTLRNMGTDIVLDAQALGPANARIAGQYRIPSLVLERPAK